MGEVLQQEPRGGSEFVVSWSKRSPLSLDIVVLQTLMAVGPLLRAGTPQLRQQVVTLGLPQRLLKRTRQGLAPGPHSAVCLPLA